MVLNGTQIGRSAGPETRNRFGPSSTEPAADDPDPFFAHQQLARYLAICQQLESEGYDPILRRLGIEEAEEATSHGR